MKIPQYKTKLSMMIIFASIILIILSMASVYYFHTGDEASVGIFSLAVTLIGTIFIAVELKNGQDVTCSEMLINLNNYFHDSDRLMKVYQVLEDCEMDGDYSDEKWKDVSSVEVAQYLFWLVPKPWQIDSARSPLLRIQWFCHIRLGI